MANKTNDFIGTFPVSSKRIKRVTVNIRISENKLAVQRKLPLDV
jgi:hypothetical protein